MGLDFKFKKKYLFQVDNYYMFATEYAPLGDLTSNVGDNGIGEASAKRVAQQIGSALEWVHSKNLCHLDVKLDNILVNNINVLRPILDECQKSLRGAAG
jgi:serine/threonine protein kinase